MDHARSKGGLLGSYLDLIPFLIFKEEFEDIKGVIRIRKSKKDRRHNTQKKRGQKDKQRYTKHTHKTKDRET